MIRKGMFIGDRYEIIDKVGSGGMSDVYKALDHKLNRYVAIKVLKDEFSEDKNFVSKFKVEAQSAAGLSHPNIVNVYDVGEDNGIYFIVMELVEGITLKKYIEKKGKLPIKEAVSIAIQVAQGIEAAHNNHIIHRDIKPQNVIISREGKVKVTDFGIARAASANTINSNAMGSVHYISPEQARGGYIDEKSDVYSLGISLYEMITGKLPFEGDSTVTIALQHINEEMPSPKLEVPDIPISVERIIEKCTQKKSERRYLKVATLIADLKKSLITPDEDFVIMAPAANNSATIMITDEEVSIIRKGANKISLDKDDNIDDELEADKDGNLDDDFDINDDIDASNPKFDKLATIGAIVASVIVFIIFVLVLIQVMNGCNGNSDDPLTKPTGNQSTISSTQTVVPKVIDLDVDEAKKILNDSHLGVRYEYADHNTAPKGVIFEQSVADGEVVDRNTVIVVKVSNGAKKFDIPPVSGLTREEAVKLLEDKEKYGLDVKVIYEASEDVEAEECIRTSPTQPTQLSYGAHIDLYVSQGEDTSLVPVPALVGKTEESAKKALEGLMLTATVKRENSATVEVGKVISASYPENTEVPKGTSVELVVSLGPAQQQTTQQPTTQQPTTQAVKKVKKTEITVKQFKYSGFSNIPTITIPATENSEEQVVKVTEGTLSASLEVKYDGMTTTVDVTKYINSKFSVNYEQDKFKVLLDERISGVTYATFKLTLKAEGVADTVIYTEDDCITNEVEVEVK